MNSPVFSLEILLGSRRSRLPAFRRGLAAWFIFQFLLLCLVLHFAFQAATPELYELLGYFFWIFVAEHFLLIFLATPAFMAGTITDEKLKGTIQYLFTTDLTSVEIIGGKFFGRLALMSVLALMSWPVLGFVAGYAQRSSLLPGAFVLVSLVLIFVLGSLSILASVRSKQTRDAVLKVYLLCGLFAFAVWGTLEWGISYASSRLPKNAPQRLSLAQASDRLLCLNPVYVLQPAWEDNNLDEFLRRFQFMLLVYGPIGMACLGLAVWRLRAITISQIERTGRRVRAPARRAVDDDPVRWRERTAGRGLLRWLAMAAILAATLGSSYWIIAQQEPKLFLLQAGIAGILASMVAGIRASGTVSGEREKRTWDSLLLTPLDTWELLVDKHVGILHSMYPLFLAFVMPAVGVAARSFWDGDGVDALCYVVCVSLLSWAAMYYMAAAGVWCSVSSRSSWRSLVATLTGGYAYFLGTLVLVSAAYLWLGCAILPIVLFALSFAGITDITDGLIISVCLVTSLLMSWLLWRAGRNKISYARSWVDAEERYGRTFARSLTRALRSHYEHFDAKSGPKRTGRNGIDSGSDGDKENIPELGVLEMDV